MTAAAQLAGLQRQVAALAGATVPVPDAVTLFETTVGPTDAWQRRALASSSRRALWLCARQVGKSTTAAVLAAHEALSQRASLTLLISPSERQSIELARKVRAVLIDAGAALAVDNVTSLELWGGARVISLPSREQTIRGFSAPSLVIEDEASRVDDALHHAVRPMLSTSGGRLILLTTAWGKRGHFYEAWTDGGDGWERTLVPATECSRIDPGFLADERASIPPHVYASEYLCEFTDTTDAVFGADWIAAALDDAIEPLFVPYTEAEAS
jgi:hypothetical protein